MRLFKCTVISRHHFEGIKRPKTSKQLALNFIIPKSLSAVLLMTHQQHILLVFGTCYFDRNVRLVINAPKFVDGWY